MLKGILLILTACLIWGMIFIIPGLMEDFSPLEVALGRYFCLGIVSCIFMVGQGIHKWQAIPWSIWKKAAFFALVVNIFYYFSLVMGLRHSNASVIALLLGLSPITLAFYGNWKQKECSFKQLIIPSLLIACGLICVNWEAFISLSYQAIGEYMIGLCCGIFALLAWNWYVVANTQFLKKHPHISSGDWSTIIGIVTFGWVLLIVSICLLFASEEDLQKYSHTNPSFHYFLGGCLFLGFMCSWLGSFLWNIGSQAIPISLAGQLTIFETLFGILFVYLMKFTFPTTLELLGMITILVGISISMFHFRKPAPAAVS